MKSSFAMITAFLRLIPANYSRIVEIHLHCLLKIGTANKAKAGLLCAGYKFAMCLSKPWLLVATAWLVSAPGYAAGQSVPVNLLTNGSFEVGPKTAIDFGSQPKIVKPFSIIPKGARTINGWTVTKGTIDYASSAYYETVDGSRCLDMDGTPGPGSISQIVKTIPGTEYRLEILMSGNCRSLGIKNLKVSAAGVTQVFSFDTKGCDNFANMRWEKKALTFVARSPQTKIELESLSPNGSLCGPLVDIVFLSRADMSGLDQVLDKDARWHVCKAIQEMQSANTTEAMAEFERALRMSPQDVAVWDSIVATHWQKNDYKGVVEWRTKELQAIKRSMTEQRTLALLDMQDAYSKQHQLLLGKKDPDAATNLSPHNSQDWFVRGMYDLAQLNNSSQAINDLTHACNLTPRDPVILLNRAYAYTILGRNREAVADYEAASKLAPDDLVIAALLSESRCRLSGDTKMREPVRCWTKAIQRYPERADLYHYRSLAYERASKYAEAAADASLSFRLNPNGEDVLTAHVNFLRSHDKAAACRLLDEALKLKPRSAHLHELYAQVHFDAY